MYILSILSLKGGTGKTTIAENLIRLASADGFRVLGVDLDPQANLSQVLNAVATEDNLFQDGKSLEDLIQTIQSNMHLVPGSQSLAGIETAEGSSLRLAKALLTVKDSYDLVIIDAPPILGELTFNGLLASDGLIIPVEADRFAMGVITNTADTVTSIEAINNGLKIIAVAVNKVKRFDSNHKNKITEIKAGNYPVATIPFSKKLPADARKRFSNLYELVKKEIEQNDLQQN